MLARPLLFSMNPEYVHESMANIGNVLGQSYLGKAAVKQFFDYQNPVLAQTIHGIQFENPIGLAAGFDYDGYMATIMKYVGFCFNTVGTVTAQPYEGNTSPRLMRLVGSRSLLVNKGFKSQGAFAVAKRLDEAAFDDNVLGISVGSSNIPAVNTIHLAIADYVQTFVEFAKKPYVKYFELNISCPNTSLTESFSSLENFENLVREVSMLKLTKPVFVKMPSQESPNSCKDIINVALKYGINTFIFSNLVKNREMATLTTADKNKIQGLKGNLSGKPVFDVSNNLLKQMHATYKNDVILIGCGGVFNAEDAYLKIKCGASLVQLITGMIFEGPQLIGQINYGLAKLLRKDGFDHISQAVGTLR